MTDFLEKCRYEETAKKKLCPITQKNCFGSICQWWEVFTSGEKPSGWCGLSDHLDKEIVDLVRKEFRERESDGKIEAGIS